MGKMTKNMFGVMGPFNRDLNILRASSCKSNWRLCLSNGLCSGFMVKMFHDRYFPVTI